MAIFRKTAYELSQSQVTTPSNVVRFFWKLVHGKISELDSVLDLGAGDCRFAKGGNFHEYVGIEIDAHRSKQATVPDNGRLIKNCAFRHRRTGYHACIGNPPYVRHHDIESPWKENVVNRISRSLDIELNRKCNLFVYFMCLAIQKSRDDGLVAVVVPHEWVSRPSVKPFREYLRERKWEVDVHRFAEPVFPGVLTTASVTIIDKRTSTGKWQFYDVDGDLEVRRRRGPTKSGAPVLPYSSRGSIWAMRGLSPGSQQFFTLTEGERVHFGLSKRDVVPCVTTLRHLSGDVKSLTETAFRRHFVESGARCWLIRSFAPKRSAALDRYLKGVPGSVRKNSTCSAREPWFSFSPHPIPELLVSSGFTCFGPKVVRNLVNAHVVGAVTGVYVPRRFAIRKLQSFLLGTNFERLIVAHAKTLKKIEVRQLNSILDTYVTDNNGS